MMNRWKSVAVSLLLLGAGPWQPAGELQLRTESPGNLFGHGETVVVKASGGGGEVIRWRIDDWQERPLRSGETAREGEEVSLELGQLDRGYFEIEARAGGSSAKLALGVVTDHSAEPPAAGPLNVDGATSWLEKRGRHEELARLLRKIGIGWIRERFSWGATEPKPGTVRWEPYDDVADAFSRRGIRVYQIFHDSPGWSRSGRRGTRNPKDLRDVYRFTKRLAEHYRGRVRAWEVWNEPDIFFWPDLSDTFAGVQKAAYLGFKSGDPDLPVLLGSLCRGYCSFDENLFATGIVDYYDIFNWHVYAPPAAYAGTLQGYLKLLEKHGVADRPVWLTEAGIRLKATEPGGELSRADERRQAEFVPKSFAWSIAAGTDVHFFFVLPYYLENGVQFGALREDLSPRPGLVAIAAAVDLLGEARYLGEYATPDEDGYTALVFDRGREIVIVAWSEAPREVRIDIDAASVRVADVVGRRREVRARDGRIPLTVGPSPLYVLGAGSGVRHRLRGRPRPPGKLPENRPDPVVLRGEARDQRIDKSADSYLIGLESFPYAVEVCNLDERRPARGVVRVGTPEGWSSEPEELKISLGPMERFARDVRITPAHPGEGRFRLELRADFDERRPAPAVSSFRFDLASLPPLGSRGLRLDDPKRWESNISGNGRMTVQAAEGGGARFEIHFTQPGDRWCFPRARFRPAADLSGGEGIQFRYRATVDDDSTRIRLQLIEPSGAAYYTAEGWPARSEWTEATCRFSDLRWGSFSPEDPDGKLDPAAVASILIGVNTGRDELSFSVRDLRLVHWRGGGKES